VRLNIVNATAFHFGRNLVYFSAPPEVRIMDEAPKPRPVYELAEESNLLRAGGGAFRVAQLQ
jgi:hypothetical protein